MFTFDKVVEAYYSCRQGKRNSFSSLSFEVDLFRNLKELYEDIRDDKYYPSPSICFVVSRPKYRKVWAAQFRDRVVHHIIYNEISPYWSKKWSADSCATIKGRGTLYGAKRLDRHIRSFTNNWSEERWYLKCDLSNFFNSIDKNILWQLLLPSFNSYWLEGLTRKVLFDDPTVEGIYLSSPEEFSKIPKRKKLKYSGKGIGIPIGNLTSQLFANVLLNELDQFVKRDLKILKYIRYVDDYISLGASSRECSLWRKEIEEFLPSLGLYNNPKKCFIHSVNRGVHFVGHSIYPHYQMPLRGTVSRSEDNITQENINSYVSLFSQSDNSFNLIEGILSKNNLTTQVRNHLAKVKEVKESK